jgi:DNA-binding MarR family transcriptional regulator
MLPFGGVRLRNSYGSRLRILHNCIDQRMTTALADMELTASQGRILAWMVHRSDPPCAKDIEDAFHLTHPTVSGLLSRLEKKGFLEFRPDAVDRRCKRIYLLPKGKECNEMLHSTIQVTEEKLVEGFTEEEKAQFSAFIERAMHNMHCHPCKPQPKEEPNT